MVKNPYTQNMNGATIFGLIVAVVAVIAALVALIAMLLQIGLTGAGVDISYGDTVVLTAGLYLLMGSRRIGAQS